MRPRRCSPPPKPRWCPLARKSWTRTTTCSAALTSTWCSTRCRDRIGSRCFRCTTMRSTTTRGSRGFGGCSRPTGSTGPCRHSYRVRSGSRHAAVSFALLRVDQPDVQQRHHRIGAFGLDVHGVAAPGEQPLDIVATADLPVVHLDDDLSDPRPVLVPDPRKDLPFASLRVDLQEIDAIETLR